MLRIFSSLHRACISGKKLKLQAQNEWETTEVVDCFYFYLEVTLILEYNLWKLKQKIYLNYKAKESIKYMEKKSAKSKTSQAKHTNE